MEKLDNLVFVITGTLKGFSRNEVIALIERGGGRVTGSVSKNTGYLVLGDEPGSKLQKAQELGVKIINDEELVKMCQ